MLFSDVYITSPLRSLPLPPFTRSPSAFIGRLAELPSMPFAVLNGTPGYINLLDACNAWQMAAELKVRHLVGVILVRISVI